MTLVFKLPAAWRAFLALALGILLLGSETGEVRTQAVLQSTIGTLQGKVIVVDAGHGGPDPGALRDGVLEKEITLAVALQLRDYLEAAGATVVMTRTTDTDLSDMPDAPLGARKVHDLQARGQLIHDLHPDVVISIHVNATGSPAWWGAQTFYPRDGSPLSKRLAEFIQRELKVVSGTQREIEPINQYILRQTQAPAVTAEVGFLSNPGEAAKLTNPSYQKRLAWAIFLGLARYVAVSAHEPPPAR